MATRNVTWVYRVRWSNPYTYDESSGKDYDLAVQPVTAGTPCPIELQELAANNPGYGITIGFHYGQRRRWTPEAKGRKRAANMRRRIEKAAPLFAAELIEREMKDRADYFRGE